MYDPKIHHRKSIRLPEYDYSAEGFYFITICTQEKRCAFGKIVDKEMVLNKAGKIVKDEWLRTIEIRKDDVTLHEFIVIPNHFHAIVQICRGVSNTPENIHKDNHINDCKCIQGVFDTPLQSPSKSLGAIVRGFKSAVSRQLGHSVWQRNYYEHIIRNQRSYEMIAGYILNNPYVWEKDMFYIP
ncbi:MAG TPA: transposase [Candidatus Phocaeicola excrementigallinarum]|nr:transposase [Candidatus Phocaeicola excrementigallinarum]